MNDDPLYDPVPPGHGEPLRDYELDPVGIECARCYRADDLRISEAFEKGWRIATDGLVCDECFNTPGARWRIVTEQSHDGRHRTRHVSSVVLNEQEAIDHLAWEEFIALSSRWKVMRGVGYVECSHNGVRRVVSIERYTPMGDAV